ncbi:hypothetical protein MHYP_G00022060 [Metynnis hypsauchen]
MWYSCWTDHRLIRSILTLHIIPNQQKKPRLVRLSFNIEKLKNPFTRERFASSLDDSLASHGPLTGDATQQWDQFKTLVKDTAQTVLGSKKRVHQDWFDENDEDISRLLAEKQKAFTAWQNDLSSTSKRDRFKHLQSQAQTALRHMQDEWWVHKADEVQLYADTKNSKMFFSAIKAIYGPSRPSTTPLLSANGTLLKERSAINERWREHFSTLLNRPSTVDADTLELIPQRPVIDSLDLPPTLEEVEKAIQQSSSGKAPGMDGIPAEIYKAAGEGTLKTFHSIINCIWENEDVPQEFRDATIVSLYKNKGSKSDCGNYRGISLLSIAGKILARVILNRLILSVSEENLPEAQCGFRPGRSTTDMIFAVRQVQEKCKEQNKDLYAVFIDLTKAFDTVNREALWVILQRLGCPRKFVQMIRQFHDNMTGAVLSGGEASDPFEISNGVKQGCVLAPILFNLFFTCVLNHAVRDIEDGVYLRYRLDELAIQQIVDKFAEASRLFGLTIGKTEVLFQPSPLSTGRRPSIFIEGTELKTVEQFKYLGSIISDDGALDKEISVRICKASQALGRLRSRVLKQHNIQKSTKLKICKTVVLTSLLYGCETWTLYRKHVKLLESFHIRSLRSILGIRWQDRVTNLEVLDRAESTSIEALILKAQLRWTGHVIRMEPYRIPRQLLYGELSTGKRKQGRPQKRFKDCVKANITYAGIAPKLLEESAQNRDGWRVLTKEAHKSFEEKRRSSIIEARERRKVAAAVAPNEPGQFPCPHCGRPCRSKLDLHSHMRKHPQM